MNKMLQDVTSGKIAFQAYTIVHGIEKLKIQVPLKNARAFEEEFNVALAEGKNSKANLMRILSEHNGSIRSKVRS